jgi:signal transduction histidine kinase
LTEAETEEMKAEVSKIVADIEKGIQKADNSTQRISAVVHTLTDILKGATGEMRALSLLVLCKEALEATRFSTYEENLSGCKIIENITADILVVGNLEQLLQVFVNLIKNSYEAMDKQKDRQITISGRVDPAEPKMALIEISDNGPGIPPEVIPKIWGQGFSTKVKKDDSIGAAGQGQGLFVCKHIIESIHKGMITVQSKAGKGTTFIIKLPLAEMGFHA